MKYCDNCLVNTFNNKDIKSFKAIGKKDFNRIIIFPTPIKKKGSYDKSYLVLKELFKYCLNDICNYWCTSLCKCDVPTSLTNQNNIIINNCRNNLIYDYNIVKPKVVILIGSAVNHVLDISINSARNSVIVIKGIYYFSMYNPKLIDNPDYSDAIKHDVERFCKAMIYKKLNEYEIIYR